MSCTAHGMNGHRSCQLAPGKEESRTRGHKNVHSRTTQQAPRGTQHKQPGAKDNTRRHGISQAVAVAAGRPLPPHPTPPTFQSARLAYWLTSDSGSIKPCAPPDVVTRCMKAANRGRCLEAIK